MWYEKIKRFYNENLWTEQQVIDAFELGKITEDEKNDILS